MKKEGLRKTDEVREDLGQSLGKSPGRVKNKGELGGSGQRHAMIMSKWNHSITERLQEGAKRALKATLVKKENLDEFYVPGAFELGPTARLLAKTGDYDAITCLGCVIRGDTPHFEYVCQQSARLIAQASYDSGMPVIFGLLTTNTLAQAVERSSLEETNKGFEAFLAAVEMANLYDQVKQVDKCEF